MLVVVPVAELALSAVGGGQTGEGVEPEADLVAELSAGPVVLAAGVQGRVAVDASDGDVEQEAALAGGVGDGCAVDPACVEGVHSRRYTIAW